MCALKSCPQHTRFGHRRIGVGSRLGCTGPGDQAGNWSAGGVGAQPGARYAGAAWTGGWKGGELWLFGGWGMDAVGDRGYLSDVWKYTVMAEN